MKKGDQTWRPISSAPRDGSELLVYGHKTFDVALWNGVGWSSGDGSSLTPTHWQPLPPPPEFD